MSFDALFTEWSTSQDVTTSIGLMILQELKDLNGGETVESLMSELFVRYALNLDETLTDDNGYLTRQSF
jgi:hypothetical protein